MSELSSAYCEDLGENLPCHKSTPLYDMIAYVSHTVGVSRCLLHIWYNIKFFHVVIKRSTEKGHGKLQNTRETI